MYKYITVNEHAFVVEHQVSSFFIYNVAKTSYFFDEMMMSVLYCQFYFYSAISL
jgi:hypothetical protein